MRQTPLCPAVMPSGSTCYTVLPSPAGKPGGASVSVKKPPTASFTEEESSHLWGRSSAELSEGGGRGRGGWGRGGRSPRPALPVRPCGCGLSFHVVLSPSSSPVVCVKRALSDWIRTSQDVPCGFLVGMNTCMFAVMSWGVECASWKMLGAGNNKKGEPCCFLQWELTVSS